MLLSSQKFMIQPALVNLHPNEYFLMKRKQPVKLKISIFYLHFYQLL